MADVFYLARFKNAHENGLDIFGKVIDEFYAGSRHNETMHYIRTRKVWS